MVNLGRQPLLVAPGNEAPFAHVSNSALLALFLEHWP